MVAAAMLTILATGLAGAAEDATPYVGNWSFTTPGGGAGWLGITSDENHKLDGHLLWEGGSVIPVGSVYMEDGKLHFVRVDGGILYTSHPERANAWIVEAEVRGDTLTCTMYVPAAEGPGADKQVFTAERIPPHAEPPDLTALSFGDPIELIAPDSLEGWEPLGENRNGWRVEEGVLINDAVQLKEGPRIHYENLRTTQEFEDFNLKTEVYIEEKGNSGIYLRGVYEVQVEDSYGRPADRHGMGSIYGRIAPSLNAELVPGSWQKLDITLADRYVTVILNGVKVIDNQPLLGVTGGAMRAGGLLPGPIYLQGDHTSVKYRNMVLTPIE
jgi:hypothetical protein